MKPKAPVPLVVETPQSPADSCLFYLLAYGPSLSGEMVLLSFHMDKSMVTKPGSHPLRTSSSESILIAACMMCIISTILERHFCKRLASTSTSAKLILYASRDSLSFDTCATLDHPRSTFDWRDTLVERPFARYNYQWRGKPLRSRFLPSALLSAPLSTR